MADIVPNLAPLTALEKLVFGADAKKDAAGNIIEQGKGNLHDRVKKVEAALKAAVPNIAPETAANLAQIAVVASASQSAVVATPGVALPDTDAAAPAAVTVAPAPVTPAPVAVATNPAPAATATTSAVVVTPTPPVTVTPAATATTSEPVTVAAVQAAVPAAPATVIAATIAAQPKATHESIVAKLKAIFASAEAAAEEIL